MHQGPGAAPSLRGLLYKSILMCKKTILILAVLTYLHHTAGAQYYNEKENFLKANSVWAFGPTGAGLDFSSGGPVPVLTAAMGGREGCASVADSTGQLLFYLSQAGTIYNRNHVPMLNGTGLYPREQDGTSAQGALIVPVIDTPWKYYVFTNTAVESYTSSPSAPYLAYSVVDMTLDNGAGGVEAGRKNLPLYNYTLDEGMVAIPGAHCDIWLLTRTSNAFAPQIPANPDLPDNKTPYFLAWNITPEGIAPVPVVSPSEGAYARGNMAVSPDRRRIAMITYDDSRVLLCKFDPATGVVSEGLQPVNNILFGADVCFSPDNTKLYTSSYGYGIRQYDISNYNLAAIKASEYKVSTGVYYALKLYNDTIYTGFPSSLTQRTLARINNPNASGAACDLQPNAITLLTPSNIAQALPNEVVFNTDTLIIRETAVTRDTICHVEGLGYKPRALAVPAGFSFYEWDNGTAGHTREIDTPGTYWVKYYNRKCDARADTFLVSGVDLSFSLGPDTIAIFCGQASVNLQVDIPYAAYRWQDGSTSHRYRVKTPGTYRVEVSSGGCRAADTVKIEGVTLDLGPDALLCTDDLIDFTLSAPPVPGGTVTQWSNGSSAAAIHVTDTGVYWVTLIHPPCILTDTVRITARVCDCFLEMPNAFTPDGDGRNDFFLPVIKAGCPAKEYALGIYNRFGQQVFFSAAPGKGWDGSYKGQPADVGTYFYEVHFTGGIYPKAYYKKGDLILLR